LEIFEEKPALQPDVLGAGSIDIDDLVERPYVEDTREPNGSSIAFLAEFEGSAILFTGDAHPRVLVQSLNRLLQERNIPVLPLDAFKVSHHGSRNNTSPELLRLVECRRFLFSSNGTKHGHPHQETIARILQRNIENDLPTELLFNYASEQNRIWDETDVKDEWNYTTHYPPTGSLLRL